MQLNKLSIADVDVKGKRVFIRVDFNVPQDENGAITNTARIDAAIPTLKHCLDQGAKSLVIVSHLGRPKGTGFEAKYSMKPCAEALEKIMGVKVQLLNDCVGPEVEAACANPAEKIIMLENVRFHAEEQNENEEDEKVVAFRKSLAKLADIYCDDAFGTAHRPHSSMVGQFYETRCAGFLMIKEIEYFRIAISEPKRPYLAILGGAKIGDKIKLIENLIPKINDLIICGGMAYTFLKLQGMSIGRSLYDAKNDSLIPVILALAEKHNVKIHLPVDFIIADDFKNDANIKIVTKEEGIPDAWEGLDIGPKSLENFKKVILESKTVIWNGPAGVFEMDSFAKGTFGLVDACAEATKHGVITIIGGGDSATAAKKAKAISKMSHVSTGGGAAIELLQGEILPGVARLSDK
ncbi:Phosphoglycerate_kinase [Hexamita inflata]|uniref:Phosphoglycerate kinase n=1 Tax=Hexamita inflata TaxID=28002 RepID=A0AA86NX81_9EUKA|nr:Phosphoglycerate kinase [Hexamita inflata]